MCRSPVYGAGGIRAFRSRWPLWATGAMTATFQTSRSLPYINGLHPDHHDMYRAIEQVLSRSIQPWNDCLVRGRRGLYDRACLGQLGPIQARIVTYGVEWENELPEWAVLFRVPAEHRKRLYHEEQEKLQLLPEGSRRRKKRRRIPHGVVLQMSLVKKIGNYPCRTRICGNVPESTWAGRRRISIQTHRPSRSCLLFRTTGALGTREPGISSAERPGDYSPSSIPSPELLFPTRNGSTTAIQAAQLWTRRWFPSRAAGHC